MKNIIPVTALCLTILILPGCGGNGGAKSNPNQVAAADTQSVADTGFTGIRKYWSKKTLTFEVTMKNGVRNGLMKTYYPNGKTRQTFWYENGVKEDTAVWFYEEGPVFRKTPFRKDSMNGVQIQYYLSGALRAKIGFQNGLRTGYFEEFSKDGKKVTGYPSIVATQKDLYRERGTYEIYLSVDQKDVKVSFYLGDMAGGLFNPKILKRINSSDYTGFIKLTRGGSAVTVNLNVVAEITTALGNKFLATKTIKLPYNDLTVSK